MRSPWITLGKFCLLVVFCLFAVELKAEIEHGSLSVIPDLIYEDLADIETTELYDAFSGFNGGVKLDYYFREDPFARTTLHLKSSDLLLQGGFWEQNYRAPNFQVRLLDSIVLGNYRLKVGEGLVFSRSSGTPQVMSPPHPRSFSPQGLSIDVAVKDWHLMSSYSRVKRDVRISENKISYLPKSKGDYLGSSMESIGSLIVWHQQDRLNVGALYYHQEYDKGFVRADQDSLLQVVGIFAQADTGQHMLSLEWALQKSGSALRTEWGMSSGCFQQKWRYSYVGDFQRPAYAGKPLLLSSLDERDEILAELSFTIHPSLVAEAGTVQSRRFGDLGDPPWLSHSSLRVRYQDHDSRLAGTVKLIDREILTAVDSSFVTSIPKHYRFSLQGAHRVSKAFELDFAARYHYQEKVASLSSGAWWQQGVSLIHDIGSLWAGLSFWSSANYKMILPDDSDVGYETIGKNSARAELRCKVMHRSTKLELRLRQDLKQDKATNLDLSLSGKF